MNSTPAGTRIAQDTRGVKRDSVGHGASARAGKPHPGGRRVWNRPPRAGVGRAMTDHLGPSGHGARALPAVAALPAVRVFQTLVALFVSVVLVGCGPAGAPSPAASPGATGGPSVGPSAPVGEIDHPTGATAVVLRIDEGGGFVAPSFLVTEAPAFSLYGDGTVIFRDPTTSLPAASDEVIRSIPFQAVRLTEDEVQALLAFALGPGGLGIARTQYQLPVADAPTTTFSVAAGGVVKSVSVNGLGLGAEGGADAAVLQALANLRARLMSFGTSVRGETPWRPDRYRGILMEVVGGGDQPGRRIAWPWTGIRPSDFVQPAGQNASSWPTRALSPADVAALGLDGLEGGAQGILLERPAGVPSGMPYELALRPLLPDEPN